MTELAIIQSSLKEDDILSIVTENKSVTVYPLKQRSEDR